MTAFDVVSELLVTLQVVSLTVALVLSTIAARGYRGTPWGRVLAPMPVMLAGFLLTGMLRLVSLPDLYYSVASSVLWTVSVGAMVLSVYRLHRMARGDYL